MTYENNYIESVWNVKEINKQNFYKDYSCAVVPEMRHGAPATARAGYEDVKDLSGM